MLKEVYLVGESKMIGRLIPILMRLKVLSNQINFEQFQYK